MRAVRDSAEHAGGRDVYLVFEPMAAALGMGLDVEAPEGNMIVDIGGGSTEIAVISLGGIVCNNSIRVAGDDLTADIQEYMSRQHNVRVSERMAERIKVHVGSALTDLGDEAPEDYIVHGPNRITALPMEVPVCYQEIAHCLDKTGGKNRECCSFGYGKYTTRIICRYSKKWYLFKWWRSFVTWNR